MRYNPFPENAGLLLLLLAVTGCISETNEECESSDDAPARVAFTLTVARNGANGTRSVGTEQTLYDAAVNPESVQAYLVNPADDNTLAATLEELRCYFVGTDDDGDSIYQYYGTVDKENATMTDGANYRCMITANTPDALPVTDKALPAATAWSYALTQLPTTTQGAHYIPLWGVQTFTWKKGAEVQRVGTVPLLRAATKTRVSLGSKMTEEGYTLTSVKLLNAPTTGYVLPAHYTEVAATDVLNPTETATVDCFNPWTPTAVDETTPTVDSEPTTADVVFHAEPGNTAALIAYAPEHALATQEDSKIEVHLAKGGSEIDTPYYIYYKDYDLYNKYAEDAIYTELQRNRVYNFTVTGISTGLYADLSVNWDEEEEEIDFTEHASGEWIISWKEGTYESLNEESKLVTVKSSVPTELSFNMQTPVGATWFAMLAQSSTSADDYIPFKFVTDSGDDTSVSGKITKGTTVTLRVKATNAETTIQHEAVLNVYIKYINGLTRKVEELSGWRFVQN